MKHHKLGSGSVSRLEGVDPCLVAVVTLALSFCAVDFGVKEGVRTLAKQREYLASGASRTLASRHLTGHAVDLLPSRTAYDSLEAFAEVSRAMFQAADELEVLITWGADWNHDGVVGNEGTIEDHPHFEICKPHRIGAAKAAISRRAAS